MQISAKSQRKRGCFFQPSSIPLSSLFLHLTTLPHLPAPEYSKLISLTVLEKNLPFRKLESVTSTRSELVSNLVREDKLTCSLPSLPSFLHPHPSLNPPNTMACIPIISASPYRTSIFLSLSPSLQSFFDPWARLLDSPHPSSSKLT